MERRNADMSSSSAATPTYPDPATSTSGDPSISTTPAAGSLAGQLRFIHDTCNEACIRYLEMFVDDCKRWPVTENRRRIMEMHETVGASDSLLDNARTVYAIQKVEGTASALHPRELPPDLSRLPFPVDLIVTASVIREAYENPDSQHEVLFGLYYTGYILCVLLGFPKEANEMLQTAEYVYAIDVDLLRATINKMVERGEIIPEVKQEETIPEAKQEETSPEVEQQE